MHDNLRQIAEKLHEEQFSAVPFGDWYRGFCSGVQHADGATIKFEPERFEGVTPAGFWEEWFGGQGDGIEFVVGKSVMNGVMHLFVTVDGEKVMEKVDMTKIVDQWVTGVVKEVRDAVE